MDEATQAQAYADADSDSVNTLFTDLFASLCPAPYSGRVIDLGCGPCDIPLQLLHNNPELRIDAVDGARSMLDLATQAIKRQNLSGDRLQLLCETLPCADLASDIYNTVMSKSLLHHLADPMDLWLTARHCGRSGARLLVMDLVRPASELAVDGLVETYAMNESDILREDFRNSLFAAYTIDEIRAQLKKAGLPLQLKMVSDRHWAAVGRLD